MNDPAVTLPPGARPPTLGTPVGTAVPRGTAAAATQSAYGAGAPAAGDMVPMRSPDGKLGYVHSRAVAAATAAGGTVVQ